MPTLTLRNLATPYPNRRAATVLKRRLVEELVSTRPDAGARLPSHSELAEQTGLSGSTIRRALRELYQEGWLDWRVGQGTFVGPRVALAVGPRLASESAAAAAVSPRADGRVATRRRVAVLVRHFGDLEHDWYTPAVLRGLDGEAERLGLGIELIGERDGDLAAAVRRLSSDPPDVLAFAEPDARQVPLIHEAAKLGVRCVRVGDGIDVDLPTVVQDDAQGARLATDHLLARGHRRIGLIQWSLPYAWVFRRRAGHHDALRAAGVEVDQNLTLWLDADRHRWSPDEVADHLRRTGVTAVVVGCGKPLHLIGDLVKAGRVAVPGGLSVVAFDQYPELAGWLGGIAPTTLALPLEEMGAALARLAAGVEQRGRVEIACRLVEGASVAGVT